MTELCNQLSPLEKSLISAMEELEVIDCHEHLNPEKTRVDSQVDVFTLFSHYTGGDLKVAGMSEGDYQMLFNRNIPIELRWKTFEPCWERIRWGSYARAALIAARTFYGADDINARTYADISSAMQEANTPGLYKRVLGDACRIRTALTQCRRTDLDSPLLTPVMPLIYDVETWDSITHTAYEPEAKVRTLDDLIDAMRGYILRVKQEGAVGLKMASNPYGTPDRESALGAFAELRDARCERLPIPNPLRDYVIDRAIAFATHEDMVVAAHTGYWGDFRELDPLHMIPILQRHKEARFDVYHVGFPWMREALMLGKGFPNVWLNFCWVHIISQRYATTAMDEALDLIPTNKILAFGGDYHLPVEKVYGHLVMAREDMARPLARRVEEGRMTEKQALQVAKMWLWDNPRELYRLDL